LTGALAVLPRVAKAHNWLIRADPRVRAG
jgi:hypothetical protein